MKQYVLASTGCNSSNLNFMTLSKSDGLQLEKYYCGPQVFSVFCIYLSF